MINHTTSPSERAASIADREAEKVWEKTGNFREYLRVWFSVYEQTLVEFVFQIIIQEN